MMRQKKARKIARKVEVKGRRKLIFILLGSSTRYRERPKTNHNRHLMAVLWELSLKNKNKHLLDNHLNPAVLQPSATRKMSPSYLRGKYPAAIGQWVCPRNFPMLDHNFLQSDPPARETTYAKFSSRPRFLLILKKIHWIVDCQPFLQTSRKKSMFSFSVSKTLYFVYIVVIARKKNKKKIVLLKNIKIVKIVHQ